MWATHLSATSGEEALTPYIDGEWHHAAQSVRVFSVLEPLNLTWEVLDGIRAHSWKIDPPAEHGGRGSMPVSPTASPISRTMSMMPFAPASSPGRISHGLP